MASGQFSLQGQYHPRYESVAVAFAQNFIAHGEVGASCCIKIEGETVVDIWGGEKDPNNSIPWDEDTISLVFSCTKAMTALCAQILIDRGQLELDEPVATYWPEFAQLGKEQTTVRMMLNHSAPVPVFRQEVPLGSLEDFEVAVTLLEQENAHWAAGSKHGYHMINFGWTVGELVRRASGMDLDLFFRTELTDKLNADFWMSLPESKDHRIAKMILFIPDENTPQTEFLTRLADPNSDQFKSLFNMGGLDIDSPAGYRAVIGGAGGVANARALATLFAPFANDGVLDGKSFLSKSRIEDMSQPSSAGFDETLRIPTVFGQGFMLRMDNRKTHPFDGSSLVIPEGAFGHVGAGGSVVFADPARRVSFGYTMTKMGSGLLLNKRGQSLVDALYAI